MTAEGRAAGICGTELINKLEFNVSHCFRLSGYGDYRRVFVLLITILCLHVRGVIAQMPPPASSGSGVALFDPPPRNGITIRFDYGDDLLAPRGPMESHYAYDPKTIVVLDHTGKPIDISAIPHRRVAFKAMPNRHPTGNLLDDRMEITKLVLQPPEAQPGSAVEELEKGRQKEAEQMKAVMAQWQQYQEQERKKKAAEEAAARAKAEREEDLRQQLAKKQQESLRAAEEEKKLKLAQAKQKAAQSKATREQFAATIIRTKAKIDQQDVAPAEGNTNYAVSPRGLHLAIAALKGSRPQVLMDGVPGPAFDELLWVTGRRFEPITRMAQNRVSDIETNFSNAPVIFSEDGTRFAYVGRQGNQFVLMADGKEAARGVDIPKHHWTDQGAVDSLSFIPGSNRFRYILTIPKPKELEGRPGAYRGTQLVVEGDKNPPLETIRDTPICFSADGKHYAYYAGFPAQASNGWQGEFRLVVDGKVDPPQYAVPGFLPTAYKQGKLAPLYTGDSQHLVTVRDRRLPDTHNPGHTTDGPATLFVDQKPVLETPFIERQVRFGAQTKYELRRFYAGLEQVSVAPAGTNFIAVFAMPSENPMQSSTTSAYRLFFNDQKVADEFKVESIEWSPDGKRYSAVCKTKQNSMFMVIDGKKEPEYARVSNVYQGHRWVSRAFTADSSKSVYLGWTDKEFIVVEGEESDGFKAIDDLTFSKQGGHIAFVATNDADQKIPVIDGQALEPRTSVSDFMFTPDGTHYALLAGGRGNDQRDAKVIVDGVEQPFKFGGDFIHYTTGSDEPDRKFLFSPDGKHVVYLASFGRVDTGGHSVDHPATKAVCLDGKLIPCEGERSEITSFFAPDSKHIIWIDWGDQRASTGGYSIYVDGQQDVHFDVPNPFARTREASEMGVDGSLRLLAQVGNGVKELRITPSAETNLTRFAALADERELAAGEEPPRSTQANR